MRRPFWPRCASGLLQRDRGRDKLINDKERRRVELVFRRYGSKRAVVGSAVSVLRPSSRCRAAEERTCYRRQWSPDLHSAHLLQALTRLVPAKTPSCNKATTAPMSCDNKRSTFSQSPTGRFPVFQCFLHVFTADIWRRRKTLGLLEHFLTPLRRHSFVGF